MKHKIGDRVRIRSKEWCAKDENGNVSTERLRLVFGMAKYRGKEATILSVCGDSLGYRLDIDDKRYCWSDEMFEDTNEGTGEEQTKSNKMKYKKGDRVRIKSRDWYDRYKNDNGYINVRSYGFDGFMARYCGMEATIAEVDDTDGVYRIDIDDKYWVWTDDMFEGMVEDVAEDTNETENTESTPFRRLTNELADTLERKNHDYGNSFADLFKKYGLVYPIIHLAEKLGRIETLAKQPNKVDGESIKDSLKDLAGYCILTLKEMDNGK